MNQSNMVAGLHNLMYARHSKRKRISSYDRSGGNDDRIYIQPGETRIIADIQGAGMITHIWMTHMNEGFQAEEHSLRKIVFKCYWDGEINPSVLVPLGDFFGMGHAETRNFVSAPLQMSPEDGKSLNSWWIMPFAEGAKLSITNECDTTLILYFYIDYETFEKLPEETLRFHASWHRELTTKGKDPKTFRDHNAWCFEGDNVTGDENYVILEAEGKGHYCGCNINIHNLHDSSKWDWPGEGDDMIFIDGEPWPPNLHGTGTEDYVNMAWCPTQEYHAPYHGLILGGKDNWKGKISYYRYHIQDPIMFEKSIRVTIEHGHNNNRSDDWSSTAYWYQSEPHKPFAKLPDVEDRLPVDEELFSRLGIIKTKK
ncbi:MAG: DUF2961 domain-containing protein [Acholeplasmatales bacterium]|nr:MAG: DUF2961 domain-containing protein [Acholeplasmatales bacterium]